MGAFVALVINPVLAGREGELTPLAGLLAHLLNELLLHGYDIARSTRTHWTIPVWIPTKPPPVPTRLELPTNEQSRSVATP